MKPTTLLLVAISSTTLALPLTQSPSSIASPAPASSQPELTHLFNTTTSTTPSIPEGEYGLELLSTPAGPILAVVPALPSTATANPNGAAETVARPGIQVPGLSFSGFRIPGFSFSLPSLSLPGWNFSGFRFGW